MQRFALRPLTLILFLAVAGGLAMQYAHTLLAHEPGDPPHVADTWLMDALLLTAAGFAGWAAVRGPRPRIERVLMAAGVGVYALAFVSFHLFVSIQGVTFPTVADVLWMSFYVVAFLALALKFARLSRGAPMLWLDAAANACALVAVGWHVVAGPAVAMARADVTFTIGNVGYVIGDLVLGGMLLAVITAARFRMNRGVASLAAAILLLVVADVGYARAVVESGYVSGVVLDPIWVTAMLAIAGATWFDRPLAPGRHGDGRDVAAAAISPVLAVLAMGVVGGTGGEGAALALVLASVACVSLRLIMTLRANAHLLEAVREAEAGYRQLVETSQDVIWSLDTEGRVTFINEAARRVLGYPPEELIGKPFGDFIAPARAACAAESYGSVLEGQSLSAYQTETVRPDGSRRTLLVSAAPKTDAKGRVLGTTGTASDITSLIAAQDERAQLQQRATELERLEALGRLSGGIAHDFNNLTAIMLTYADFLGDELSSDQARSDLVEIRSAAERAAELTRQLLVFSRHDAGDRERVDVNVRLEETGRMLRRTLEERIELVVRPAGEPLYVELGPGQFDQMVMNLAINARDALHDGGRLELALEPAGPGRARLTVSDDGAGMEPEVCRRIFEPFYTTKSGGTGLGLATVYGIVRHAGGEVEVDSAPESGTCFRIELPLALRPDDGDDLTAEEQDAEPLAVAGTVLLVEDEPALREVISRALTRAGLTVIAAGDGEEAVGRAREVHFDVLLSDMVMPGPSGPDTARRVQELQPHVVPVFMSGYNQETIQDLDSGPVMRKPFMPEELVCTIRRVLSAQLAPAAAV